MNSTIALLGCLWLWAEWRSYFSAQQIKKLLVCPTFGCLTRQGLTIHWKGIERRANQAIIFIDLDKMHELNERLGYEEVDRRIHAVCSVLGSQMARWYSGDELILSCPIEKSLPFAMQVEAMFVAQGIGATWAIAPLTGMKLEVAVAIAAADVQRQKLARGSSR